MNLIEDHQRLIQENQRLRVLLQYDEGLDSNEDERLAPSSGSDNLTRIYMEGFHICHPNFGQLRTDDSDNNGCLFCRSLLQKTALQKEQLRTSEDYNESKGSSI